MYSDELKFIESILQLIKKYNVKNFKIGESEIGELEIVMGEPERIETPVAELAPQNQSIGIEHGNPTAEELLFWSSGYTPNIKPEEPK